MFQYLNQSDEWPRMRRFGLEVDADTGALTLRKLPGPPKQIACLPGPGAAALTPGGIAIGPDGAIYVADANARQVFRIDPAQGKARLLECISTKPMNALAEKSTPPPMGLAFQTCRNRLLIADAQNSRIQVVDPIQDRVVAVWGQTWPYEMPGPCGKFEGLDGPEHLTCDRSGNVYVIDCRNAYHLRIVKLDRDGNVTFAVKLKRAAPIHIAIGHAKLPSWHDTRECVFVLAIDSKDEELRLFLFDTNLEWLRDSMRLLGPEMPQHADASSTVSYGFDASGDPSKATKLLSLRKMVTAFTVIGSTAVVGLASAPPRVWCFEIGDALVSGAAILEPSWLPRYDGAATGLSVRGNPDQPGPTADLLLFTGRTLHSLPHRGAFRTQGAFLAGPFTGDRDQFTQWHRLRFDGRLNENGRIQWFTLSRSGKDFRWAPPVRPGLQRLPEWFRYETQPDLFEQLGFAGTTETEGVPERDEFAPLHRSSRFLPASDPDRTPPNQWFAAPENQLDALVRNAGGAQDVAADQLWILGVLAGDGLTSPSCSQARLEHAEDGWLSDLPETYQRNAVDRAFMRSLLALLESRFEDMTGVIDRLPSLFSPENLSARFGRRSPELDWLRSTLALSVTPRLKDKKEDRDRNDRAFADGPYWLARRGTCEGLRRLLWLATGVEVVIDEPGLDGIPDVFGVPDTSVPADPGTTEKAGLSSNILGYATLPDPEDSRPRLPDDLAHHFVVRGYASDLIDREVRSVVEQVLGRLAPAHCTYSLQVIEPRARVGIQACLGVDTVVAPSGPADPLTLDDDPGPDAQIDPTPVPPTIGAAHLGKQTPLM